jgi:2-methylcitrate dehydratase PrpD
MSQVQLNVNAEATVPIAAAWGEFCASMQSKLSSADALERARSCLADHLHAAILGLRSETCARLIKYLGWDGRQSMVNAESLALLLGAASTVHEIDDVHWDTSMHPGSVVVSAALGCLIDAPVSGARLLNAIVGGYEVAIRLSIAAGERHYQYFHSTATCGTIAAAATAAIVYGLSADETANAIGAAASSASGLWEGINDRATGIKHLHSGFAAERGIRAAKLGRLGLRAARLSIEGERGFLSALVGRASDHREQGPSKDDQIRDILLSGLGERWTILRNIYKRYPFCLACFEPLEGIQSILEEGNRRREDVDTVLLELYPRSASIVSNVDPRDQLQAKFSATFATALVLAGYDPSHVTFPEDWLVDPAVRRWYPAIRMVASTEIPRRRARVTVRWLDGAKNASDQPLRSLTEVEALSRFSAVCRQLVPDRAQALERAIAGVIQADDATDLILSVRAVAGV